MNEFFTVMMIDPRTGAPAAPPVEGLASADALRAVMARTPTVDGKHLLSWGDVTRDELKALVGAGLLELDDTTHARDDTQGIWSIICAR